jgi:PPK2 family polyphosphate:nucleotide phosphotransferase
MAAETDFEQRFRVPSAGFRLADRDPTDCAGLTKKEAKKQRTADLERLADLQDRLFAEGRRMLLVVLQGLDASGKDSTIKHVMSGVNPQGVRITSFKQPTRVELEHDFLWRAQVALPARGRIGVFNRSHYEEVVVVRVHPDLLANQAIDPSHAEDPAFWGQRFEDITTWERHLTRDCTRVIKFFLHVSKAEQLKRFMARAERPDKHWKFSPSDLRDHQYWDSYQEVYERALTATSTPAEPWYVIPADHKWFLRTAVAAIIVAHLSDMDPQYPMPSEEELAEMHAALTQLISAERSSRVDGSRPSVQEDIRA